MLISILLMKLQMTKHDLYTRFLNGKEKMQIVVYSQCITLCSTFGIYMIIFNRVLADERNK